MGFLIFLIIVVILGGIIFIQIKISNLKYRAEQHVLKGTGISSSDINNSIYQGIGKQQLEKFLQENPNYTEEAVKNLLREYSTQMIQQNCISEFSNEVCEKIQQDSKFNKLKNMEFKTINIVGYQNQKLNAIAVYTDNRDEYNLMLFCSIENDKVILNKYRIDKGAVVGF